MSIVEHELKKYDMWQEELTSKRKVHDADKLNLHLKKAYDRSLKQFNGLMKKQDQLLRGTQGVQCLLATIPMSQWCAGGTCTMYAVRDRVLKRYGNHRVLIFAEIS